MASNVVKAQSALREYALGFPQAVEEFPWGDRVVTVNKKIFVFLGQAKSDGGELSLSVKLPRSRALALELPFTEPTGYGLGKAGWVSAKFSSDSDPPLELLMHWVDESYRAVAPTKLVAVLDGAAPPVAKNEKRKRAAKKPARQKKR
jgi:predicted DNA-binding protein (MmcQ/YjbR family)